LSETHVLPQRAEVEVRALGFVTEGKLLMNGKQNFLMVTDLGFLARTFASGRDADPEETRW
jgi:hypothetical protein